VLKINLFGYWATKIHLASENSQSLFTRVFKLHHSSLLACFIFIFYLFQIQLSLFHCLPMQTITQTITYNFICYFIMSWKSKNDHYHSMTTTVTLCFDNGLQFNPVIVHVDFELAAMKVLKEIFWNVRFKCYRFQINTCMIWFNSILVMNFLVNSTPVLLGLNTKQERNYETIMYILALNV
jgi:hypothetical protein